MDSHHLNPGPLGIDPVASRRIFFLMLTLGVGAYISFTYFKKDEPVPAEVANDPLLTAGRDVYLARCAGCHGTLGRGDGPTSKGLAGPPVGDLTDDKWKHGSKPEEVLAVIRDGVKDTGMAAWKGVLRADDLRAVTAYVYYLAGREPPETLRASPAPPSR